MSENRLAPAPLEKLTGARRMEKNFILLLGGALILSLAMSSWGTLLPVYFKDRIGLSVQQIGLLMTGASLVGIFLSLPVGSAIDKLGRWKGLLFSILLFVAMQMVLGLWPSLLAVVLVVILSIFANQSHEVAENALVADFSAEEVRTERYTQLDMSTGLISILGPVIGGMVIWRVGYQPLFLAGALFTLVSAAPILLIRGTFAARPVTPPEGGEVSLKESLARVWSVRRTRMLAVALVASSVAMSLSNYMFVIYAEESLGITLAQLGGVFSIAAAAGIIPVLLGARLIDRFGKTRPMGLLWLLGGVVLVAGFLILGLSSQMVVFVVVVASFNLIMSISQPTIKAIVMDIAPAEHRGGYQGALMAVSGLSTIPGPMIGGLIYSLTPVGPFIASGALYVLAAVFLLSLPAKPKGDL